MPKQEKNPNDPSETSFSWDAMAPRWLKMETLLGGTEAMRKAGTRYLPQHEEESDPGYNERLFAATLFNLTELTLDSLVGRPFSDPVEKVDMPEEVDRLMDDLDLQGNNLDVFTRNWFREGLAKAFAHVLVDFPRVATEEELGRPRTVADDQREGVRPYWVLVKPENVIFASSEIVDSREVLTHVRIHEVVTERVGFAEVRREKIRVYDAGFELPDGTTVPTQVTLYRKLEKPKRDEKGRKIEWEVEDQWDLGITFIPLVTFYAHREGLMEGQPPLEDLADLNIAHWQSSSDQRATLTVARFPMLAASGAVDADRLRVGPRQWLNMPDPQGKFYYVEHQGAALDAGWSDLDKLVDQMCQYGAEFLKKRPDRETALARSLDSAEATSPLQDMTIRFIDAVNTALAFTAAWMKIESAGKVDMTTDFGPEESDQADHDQLKTARENRDISHATYLREIKRRGVLGDDFDQEKNDAELEEEMAQFMDAQREIDEAAADRGEEGDGDEA